MVDRNRQPRCARAVQGGDGGFSLVELLVAVVIIGILIAISITSLGGVRLRGRSTYCASSLRSIFLLHTSFAETTNKSRYANDFEPVTGVVEWTLGSTMWVSVNTLDQTRHWLGPLVESGFIATDLGDVAKLYCPEVLGTADASMNPQVYPQWSYWYSAAMYTRPELWKAENGVGRERPNDFRGSVRVDEVIFPSQKVLQFETADYHGRKRYLTNLRGQSASLNVVCCDGSVSSRDLLTVIEPLEVPWPQAAGEIVFSGPMFFSSAPGGCRGRDW